MQKKSFFKIVFFILSGLTGILILSIMVLALAGKSIDPDFPTFMSFYFIIIFLFVGAMLAGISVYVYKDAPRRGMDPWLWMTIAVFVPNLIGIIIYLIVRKSNAYEKKCLNCQKPVSSEFRLCPFCGSELNVNCPECGREVSGEWVVCPYCSKSLK